MNIHVVKPSTFCPGVKKVVEKTLQIIDDYKSSNIYLIGNIVHNTELCKQLLKHKNVKILDNKNHDRLALVKSIKTNNNVVIFSAHGTDWKAIDYAETQGWKVFDLTCPYVQRILFKIECAIRQGYRVAYYGDKNHVEAIAAKSRGGDNIFIYKNKNDLHKILDYGHIQVLSQSTMNQNDFLATQKWFTAPAIVKFSNTICHSSKLRQENVDNARRYDIVFVISDPQSHNGVELFNLLKTKQKQVLFIDPLHIKINPSILKKKKDCAVFTSSSVSPEQLERFLKYLRKLV